MKILIGLGVAILIVVVTALVMVSGVEEPADNGITPIEDASSVQSGALEEAIYGSPAEVEKVIEESEGGSGEAKDTGTGEGVDAESVEDALERALQSMQESLTKQDERTPEMSKPYERELPSEEELADPALYQAYELRQTRKMAALFAGVKKEIPVIQAKISAARLNGTQTEEEIQEAEEALLKMESLSEFLRLKFPDIDQESDTEISSLKKNYDADR